MNEETPNRPCGIGISGERTIPSGKRRLPATETTVPEASIHPRRHTSCPTRWIFLRGLGRVAGHWGDFPKRCEQSLGWRVQCLDLPGFGSQYQYLCPTTVDAITREVQRRAGLAAGEPVGLLGLSLGAMVALQWAAQAPDQVKALVLINASSRDCPLYCRLKPTALWAVLRCLGGHSIKRQERTILNLVSNRHGDDPHLLARWVQLRQGARLRKRNVLRQLLAASRFCAPPVGQLRGVSHGLVISSKADRMVSWRCSKFLTDTYGWPLLLAEGAGHELPLDAPQWLVEALAGKPLRTNAEL